MNGPCAINIGIMVEYGMWPQSYGAYTPQLGNLPEVIWGSQV